MVAIIGILAAVAIPAFMKYVRRSKTTEATMNIRKIWDSAVAYYESEHAASDGSILAKQFPDGMEGSTPVLKCCINPGEKCAPNPSIWNVPSWAALNFSVDDPHYYQYTYGLDDALVGPSGVRTGFIAMAVGDLDCDDTFSTFMRHGKVLSDLSVSGGAGLTVINDIE